VLLEQAYSDPLATQQPRVGGAGALLPAVAFPPAVALPESLTGFGVELQVGVPLSAVLELVPESMSSDYEQRSSFLAEVFSSTLGKRGNILDVWFEMRDRAGHDRQTTTEMLEKLRQARNISSLWVSAFFGELGSVSERVDHMSRELTVASVNMDRLWIDVLQQEYPVEGTIVFIRIDDGRANRELPEAGEEATYILFGNMTFSYWLLTYDDSMEGRSRNVPAFEPVFQAILTGLNILPEDPVSALGTVLTPSAGLPFHFAVHACGLEDFPNPEAEVLRCQQLKRPMRTPSPAYWTACHDHLAHWMDTHALYDQERLTQFMSPEFIAWKQVTGDDLASFGPIASKIPTLLRNFQHADALWMEPLLEGFPGWSATPAPKPRSQLDKDEERLRSSSSSEASEEPAERVPKTKVAPIANAKKAKVAPPAVNAKKAAKAAEKNAQRKLDREAAREVKKARVAAEAKQREARAPGALADEQQGQEIVDQIISNLQSAAMVQAQLEKNPESTAAAATLEVRELIREFLDQANPFENPREFGSASELALAFFTQPLDVHATLRDTKKNTAEVQRVLAVEKLIPKPEEVAERHFSVAGVTSLDYYKKLLRVVNVVHKMFPLMRFAGWSLRQWLALQVKVFKKGKTNIVSAGVATTDVWKQMLQLNWRGVDLKASNPKEAFEHYEPEEEVEEDEDEQQQHEGEEEEEEEQEEEEEEEQEEEEEEEEEQGTGNKRSLSLSLSLGMSDEEGGKTSGETPRETRARKKDLRRSLDAVKQDKEARRKGKKRKK
jgi:hypothetical protein